MTNNLNNLRLIEQSVYPSHMWGLQDVYSVKDLQEYCESKTVAIYGTDTWYCIVAKKEVVDLASINNLDLRTLLGLLTDLREWFGTKSFTMDCKKDTSYILINRLVVKGIRTLKEEESWDWAGVEMVHIKVKFK